MAGLALFSSSTTRWTPSPTPSPATTAPLPSVLFPFSATAPSMSSSTSPTSPRRCRSPPSASTASTAAGSSPSPAWSARRAPLSSSTSASGLAIATASSPSRTRDTSSSCTTTCSRRQSWLSGPCPPISSASPVSLYFPVGVVTRAERFSWPRLTAPRTSWATNDLPSLPWADGSFSSNHFMPDKAIAVGQKQALFADLDGGIILLADLSSDPPILKYFVVPSGGFDARIERLISPNFCTRFCRDVSFTNGLITFAQIENRMAISSLPQNTMELHALKDTDLIPSRNRKRSCPEPDLVCDVTGRKLVLWSRTTSEDAWSNCLVVNLDEIDLIGFTSQKAHLHLPAIAVDGNTVYLRAVGKFGDEEGHLISVDLHTKSLTTLATFATLPMERLARPRFILKDPQ